MFYMETLTYPYGETPEEVIRETQPDGLRHREFIAKRIEGLTVEQLDQYEDAVLGRAVLDLSYDDLLTVLDALYDGWLKAARESADSSEFDLTCIRYRDLRISILAALGVTES